jgi:hypothetical protein
MVLKGKDIFYKEYYELIKELINRIPEEGSGTISHFRFMNAVITALKLNEIKWVEGFIKNYNKFLQEDFREETINLTTSMLKFSAGEYEQALEEMLKINFDDCHHKMHLRNLTLQIYYELNYFESALSIIDSYKHFLAREKSISDLYKDYNSNFVAYFNELLKIKMGIGSLKADELFYEVKKSKEFANKNWILSKLTEMMK